MADKKNTMTTIDGEIKREAKERGINISKTLEDALEVKLRPKEARRRLRQKRIDLCNQIEEIDYQMELLDHGEDPGEEVEGKRETGLEMAIKEMDRITETDGILTEEQTEEIAGKYRITKEALLNSYSGESE